MSDYYYGCGLEVRHKWIFDTFVCKAVNEWNARNIADALNAHEGKECPLPDSANYPNAEAGRIAGQKEDV